MLFIPTILAFGGLLLCLTVVVLVLRNSVGSLSGHGWGERWGNTSFITFSWHELGRSLFLGLVAAAGASPMAIAVFAGSQDQTLKILYLTGVAWAGFAAGIYLVAVATGLVGFLRFEHQTYSRRSLLTLIQLLVVAAATLPIVLVFTGYLVPTLSTVVGLWLHTMGLYARLAG